MCETDRLGDDILRGVTAIAAYIGEPERRTNYLIEKGDIPAFKIRGRWRARKSVLRQHYDAIERGAMKGAAAA